MPVILIVDIPDMKPDNYRKMHAIVMGNGKPPGMIAHCSRVKDTGVSIIDIWETKQHINTFMREKLVPASKELGFEDEPEVMLISDLINADAFDYTGPLLSSY